MNHPVDPIGEADLQAYVDDQLPVARRIDVEAHLSRHPEQATQVMADLRTRDELRLALAPLPRIASIATSGAARRLERGLSRDHLFTRLRKVAAVALLMGAGWFAHAQFGSFGVSEVVASALPPAYVADAVMAHRTALVRASMPSQRESPDYDPADLRAATAIVLPALPEGWAVADVQVFPSTYGPSVEMTVRTAEFGTLSLFAVRPGVFDVRPVAVSEKDDLAAAHWQMGDVAYALVARAKARDLDQAASRLARSLY